MLPDLALVFSSWITALIMWIMHDSKLPVTQDGLWKFLRKFWETEVYTVGRIQNLSVSFLESLSWKKITELALRVLRSYYTWFWATMQFLGIELRVLPPPGRHPLMLSFPILFSMVPLGLTGLTLSSSSLLSSLCFSASLYLFSLSFLLPSLV